MVIFVPLVNRCNWNKSFSERTEPVGLWGELRMIIRVFEVTIFRSSSQSILKPGGFSLTYTGRPPFNTMDGANDSNAGSKTMTSSSSLITVLIAV